ncbi:MAG: isoprenylcysteine carboxylmethyltransferase family protein [Marinicaulis sp.]|nr:hypothetical protein [Marinicaulis sp.]NNE41966.1 isoprenylcysteine carboxylmethyltransferase family protein [Marinicaulis sp.]NNL88187.1 isoprenylcysteine carboxylmethyltransferase family protein [Marinicaulis sp.]
MGIAGLTITIIIYAVTMASVGYLVVFVSGDAIGLNAGLKTLNSGASMFGDLAGVALNIALLLFFGAQHSIMARPGFKRAWTKIVPAYLERSLYLVGTVIALVLLFAGWQPMNDVVWAVENQIVATILAWLSIAGFGLVVLSTFQFDHFEMFGLQQGWRRFKNIAASASSFKIPFLYGFIRHPLYLGFLIAFWSAPLMTAGHLLFAAIWTAYIFVAVGYEERDLIDYFGDNYRDYMQKTPMILPFGKRK